MSGGDESSDLSTALFVPSVIENVKHRRSGGHGAADRFSKASDAGASTRTEVSFKPFSSFVANQLVSSLRPPGGAKPRRGGGNYPRPGAPARSRLEGQSEKGHDLTVH